MPSSVKVVFNADTGQFVSATDGATKAVQKQADAVAQAKNTILESAKMQIAAAKEVGASSKELEAIQTRTAQMLANTTETNANRVVASLQRVSDKQKAVAAELKNLNFDTKGVDHGEITDRQRASALIRGGGVRSAENFLTQFDGFNKVATIAFPVLGAATFATEVIRGVSALKDMYDAAEHATEETRNAFQATHDAAQVSIDDLEIQNQKIQDQINKVSGHPGNGLATALLEAKKMADQLLVSLDGDRKQLEALLKEHDTGTFGKLLSAVGLGAAGTAQQGNELLGDQSDLQSQLREVSNKRDLASMGVHDPAKLKAITDQYARDVHTVYQGQIDVLRKESDRLKQEEDRSRTDREADIAAGGTGSTGGVDNSHKIANVEGRRKQLEDAQRIAELQAQQFNGNADLGVTNQHKEQERLAGEAARKAKEAMRQAIEAQRQLWQEQNDDIRTAGGDTAALEAWMWQARIDALKKGSAGYAQQLEFARHHLAEAQATVNKEDAESAKRAAEKANRDQMTQFGLDRDSFEMSGHRKPQEIADLAEIQTLSALPANIKAATDRWREAQEAADKYAEEAQRASDKAAEAAVKNKAQVDLASIALAEQTGQISRLDAAQQAANIHAAEYASTMANLRKVLAAANVDDPNGAAAINAQAAIDKADADRKVQVMQDAANSAAATWQGALRNANAAWVQDSRDTAKQVTELYQQTISGLNQNLSNLMTGKKADWGSYFGGISKTLANDSLKQVEGSVLGMFGVKGKADGSKSNPFAVTIVDSDGKTGTALSGLGKLFGKPDDSDGDDSDSDSSGAGGFFSGLVKFAAGLFGGADGGHRALGGSVQAGVPVDVGELGRERFIPKTDGYIVPNNEMGNDGASYTVNVANGVTPEQMKMHVREALRQYHPQAVSSSVAAMQSRQGRRPASSR